MRSRLATWLAASLPHLLVDDLRVAPLAPGAGDVVGDRPGQVVDVRHAVADVAGRQVDVLAADRGRRR